MTSLDTGLSSAVILKATLQIVGRTGAFTTLCPVNSNITPYVFDIARLALLGQYQSTLIPNLVSVTCNGLSNHCLPINSAMFKGSTTACIIPEQCCLDASSRTTLTICYR
ncbi:hypothetical protein PHET_04520 [Paragonimus heterotremus]|uniref:Uncharacterized protein n=1 Tax=Paragonimus heterotremus TaxID=100268 RepID=A0A8J4T1N8_9TREM|nr:hypothetical protein PHET_04520 [Paragonimus heterotremus]